MSTIEESVNETREDIPLNRGKKSSSWYSCNDACLSGSKFLNWTFGSLTFVITLALIVQIHYKDYQIVPHGSVASDSFDCSEIGTSILKQGGNAIDAAIATAFCLAVAVPHIAGLDAEGQLLIYNHRTRILPNVIDFSGSNIVSKNLPRLVIGLAYTHQQYGSLPWKSLVQPAADLARRGYLISKMLVEAVNQANAQDLYGRLEAGQLLKHENLSKTLDKIADLPEDELYHYVQSTDQPVLSQALKYTFNNYDVFAPSASSIGQLIITNLQEIEKFNFTKEDTVKPEYLYRLAETIRNFYIAQNISNKFHQGTLSNVAVMDLDDNYVSLVIGMYGFFGSGNLTMDGYVLDVRNKDKPSSRVPFLVTNSNIVCGRRIVCGASDLPVATQLIVALVVGGENATDSIEAPRFHILENGMMGLEGSHLPVFDDDVLKYLESLTRLVSVSEPHSSSNIVEKIKDDLSSHSDSRGGGIASRF